MANMEAGAAGDQSISKSGSKFRKMVRGPRLSEEQIVLDALVAYNNEAKTPRVYNHINKYAGGTLYLVEFTNPSGGQDYWAVLRRGEETQVFYDYEMALREAVMWGRITHTSGINIGSIVTSIISLAIVFTFLYYARGGDGVGAPPPALSYALSSVLGFWFGKSVSAIGRVRTSSI
jgi:hypothetical protein